MGLRKKARKRIYKNEFTVYKIWFYSTSCVLLLVLTSSLANFLASLFCQLISPFPSHKYAEDIQNVSQFTEATQDYYFYIILPQPLLGASLSVFLCIHDVQNRTGCPLYSNTDCVIIWENSLVLSVYRTDWLAAKHMPVKLRNNSTPKSAKKFKPK